VALLLEERSRVTWLTTVQITSEGREQSDLTYNLQTNCGLTVVGREHSDLTYNLQTDCGLTVVEREHSNLTYNSANYQWRKGVEQPDIQYFSLCRRPLLEGSKATWWTTLSAAAQTVVGREQSNLINNTIYSCTDCCWKGAKQPDRQHYLLLHRLL